MMMKVKGFVTANKVILILLPFILAWGSFVTSSIYTNKAEAQSAKQLIESNNKIIQKTIEGVCENVADIKKQMKDFQQDLKDHERENAEAQRKMYELLLSINKNMSRK